MTAKTLGIKGPRHIFWDGRWGMASYNGVHVELTAAPRVVGLDIELIDYAPNVGQRLFKPHDGPWCTTIPDEALALDAALEQMARSARAAFS